MYTEIEISTIDIRKGGYHVTFFDLTVDDSDFLYEFISHKELEEHIKDNGLHEQIDFPTHGDVWAFDLDTWIEENYEEAIKHYITNKI
jgi:hypothetical protein